MTDLHEFVGTWRSERGAPYSTMTFTWVATDAGLQGEWIIEAAAPPRTRFRRSSQDLSFNDPWKAAGSD